MRPDNSNRDNDHHHTKYPQTYHPSDKHRMTDLIVKDDMQERVDGNSKHEHPAHRIPDLQHNPLDETSGIGSMDGICGNPPQTDDKSQSLLEIRQSQAIYQNKVLIMSDVSLVMPPPEDEPVC